MDRHSVGCYFCGKTFDERLGIKADPYNGEDGGEICPDCWRGRTRDNLLRLVALPPGVFDGVCRTVDGMYLGRIKGGVGYDVFLGHPSSMEEGRVMRQKAWDRLTEDERQAVLALAERPMDGTPIPLEDFVALEG